MYHITIQRAVDKARTPKSSLIRQWAEKTLQHNIDAAALTIRIVSIEEMSELNATYRKKKGPTNVLSFPFDMPQDVIVDRPILGDIVICADVIAREAKEQHKTEQAHWAHMVVHGIFHLLGFDHETEHEAEEMESREINVMHILGFANPYETGEKIKT